MHRLIKYVSLIITPEVLYKHYNYTYSLTANLVSMPSVSLLDVAAAGLSTSSAFVEVESEDSLFVVKQLSIVVIPLLGTLSTVIMDCCISIPVYI